MYSQDIFYNLPIHGNVLGSLVLANEGVGINFDILETNLINLAIVLGVLFFFGKGFLGNLLGSRKADIEAAISKAESRQAEAAASLAEQQKKLAAAQEEAKSIVAKARESSVRVKEDILAKSKTEVERMKSDASRDLASEQERVISELRQRAIAKALVEVESKIKVGLSDEQKRGLVDKSIELVGGGN
ncbi:MAG: F0F1 ATP synthase subunit B [Cyanobacteria bacterium P01_C01_bin.89]